MSDKSSIELSSKAVDYRTAFYRSIANNIPLLGGLLTEVINETIPNQRIDRIQKYIESLEAKIQDLDPNEVEARFHEPEFIDLLEESLCQAVRAVSQERIEYIASIVGESLSDQERQYIQYKKILYILKELNDVEILMLLGFVRTHDKEFWDTHRDTISQPGHHMQSSQQQMDKSLVQKAYRAHLINLKLLQPSFQKPKKGQLPDFDEKTGMMKIKNYNITPLGRLVIRCIGEEDRPIPKDPMWSYR